MGKIRVLIADDFDRLGRSQKRREPHAYNGMVIGNQNTNLSH